MELSVQAPQRRAPMTLRQRLLRQRRRLPGFTGLLLALLLRLRWPLLCLAIALLLHLSGQSAEAVAPALDEAHASAIGQVSMPARTDTRQRLETTPLQPVSAAEGAAVAP